MVEMHNFIVIYVPITPLCPSFYPYEVKRYDRAMKEHDFK